jgi:hypothetical protein
MNEKLLKANSRVVRHSGKIFRIIAHRLGEMVLAQAEEVGTDNRVNLITGRSQLVMALRNSIKLGLVS